MLAGVLVFSGYIWAASDTGTSGGTSSKDLGCQPSGLRTTCTMYFAIRRIPASD